jgi:hypothetical protein
MFMFRKLIRGLRPPRRVRRAGKRAPNVLAVRAFEERLVPSTVYDWTNGSGDGNWANGNNWTKDVGGGTGTVPGDHDTAKFGKQVGTNWNSPCTVPNGTTVGAVIVTGGSLFNSWINIQGGLTVTGTDGAPTPNPLSSTFNAVTAFQYQSANCLVDFQGTTDGGGTKVTWHSGQIHDSSGDYGALKVESAVTFTIDNAADITTFQTEIDNYGTLHLSNTKDIDWQPAAGQLMISNTGNATLYFDGSGGTINDTDTKTWEVRNLGVADAQAKYTLGAWIYNGNTGTFNVQTAGPFDVKGYNPDGSGYSFDNIGHVVLYDSTEMDVSYNYHQENSSAYTAYFSLSSLSGTTATLKFGQDSATYNNFIIDGGSVNVVNPTDAYPTFIISSGGGTLKFTGGTRINLSVDGASNSADLIQGASRDTFQVDQAGTLNMLVATNNASPVAGQKRTVISGYTMNVAPNGNWGSITVQGGYGGGHWTGAVSGSTYVLTAANGGGTAPAAAPVLRSPGSSDRHDGGERHAAAHLADEAMEAVALAAERHAWPGLSRAEQELDTAWVELARYAPKESFWDDLLHTATTAARQHAGASW